MADDLVFYTNPQSRGRMVRWMLEEVGAPYRAEVVEYGAHVAQRHGGGFVSLDSFDASVHDDALCDTGDYVGYSAQ